MNILHATTDPDLLTRLREMLGSASRADIAVGYFFMSGFTAVANDLARLSKTRILVGRIDRPTLEAVAAGLQQAEALQARLEADGMIQRRHRNAVAEESTNHIADGIASLSQTDESEAIVKQLHQLVADGLVEVRAYPRGFLHAKAYLCWYDNHAEPGAAIVGSSNFTLAGFTGNTELNVRVTGDTEMAELSRWFEELWAESVDIKDSLITQLNRSWVIARTPPYHVYLKALYELYGTDMASGSELSLPTGPVALANFQQDAVRWGLSTIDQYGGCYIGDVVGLGKTYIGAELLRQLRQRYNREGLPLIICPAGLVPMWRQVNETFQLGAEVISQSVIAPPPDSEFDEELERYVDKEPEGPGIVLAQRYPERGPVLVDEAHNFRNINRRSVGLRHYLENGDHKVILLSATPQSLSPRDIYRQLRLFLDETDHGLNIEPIGLEDYFRAAERWHQYRIEYENYRNDCAQWKDSGMKGQPPPEPASPDIPHASIEQVLTPVFIRRRRKDLRELYGDAATVNNQPVQFPEPKLDNLEYRLDRVYAKAGPFVELQELLGQHRAARYRATDYLKPNATSKDEYRDLLRARGRIAGLMRVLLFKRLESSIEAFRATLKTLINSNRNFCQSLGAGYVPVGSTAARMLSGNSFAADELLEILEQEEQRRQRGTERRTLVYRTSDFEVDRWIDDLNADHAALSEISQRIRAIKPDDDDKLLTLRRFLDEPEVKQGKVLIFSEAETTIDYLYEQLNPGDKRSDIAKLSGSNRNNVTDIVWRFSPTWNSESKGRKPDVEIRVLLATDVVSEGQNLQDCARVLNYDLHWNPVRLIQRFGRVDRIGTKHSVIHLHNMWPDLAVDAGIALTERLNNRIQIFHDLIGLDSRLLSKTERLNNDDMYRIYEGKQLPELDDGLDEVTASQRAHTLLQRIQENDSNLWQTITDLPDGIRSALQVRQTSAPVIDDQYAQTLFPMEGDQMLLTSLAGPSLSPFNDPASDETLVLLAAGEVKICYAVSADLQPRVITSAQFIAAAECQPETPPAELPIDTNERVMAAFRTFQRDIKLRLGRSRRSRDNRNRRYISRQLSIVSEQVATDQAWLENIAILRRIFLNDVPPQVENALTEIRNMGLKDTPLVTRLHALRERYRLNPPDQTEQPQPTPQITRIVCSDGLV